MYYKLVEKKVVPCGLDEFARMYDGDRINDKHLAHTFLGTRTTPPEQDDDRIRVSTVFLGLDHGGHPVITAKPLVFETMVFRGKMDQYQMRYYEYDDAMAGHDEIVRMVLDAEGIAFEILNMIEEQKLCNTTT